MNDTDDITIFFENLINDLQNILKKEIYNEKNLASNVCEKVEKWFIDFKNNNTLKNILLEDLEYISDGIDEIFDKYISIEPINENYVERASYDFAHLKKYWKDEMLVGDNNVK